MNNLQGILIPTLLLLLRYKVFGFSPY